MVIEFAILMLLWMPLGCATGPAPVTRPARAPDPVDELLEKLERASDDLRDFAADIRYDKWDAVLERKVTQIIGGGQRFEASLWSLSLRS